MSISTELNAVMETGTGKGNGELRKDYEEYGISFDYHESGWYYDGDKIRILVDSEKAFVYYTDEKGVCLAVSRDRSHNGKSSLFYKNVLTNSKDMIISYIEAD